ncbi:MAG: hypothetical protein FIB07_16505 [Candidatus Methanoperedens sp.]|nr:hypothetical protein [Candidatus Methanoperedens sp.]
MTGWIDSISGKKQILFSKHRFHYFIFLILSLALVMDFFSPGYILTLDMIFTPDTFRISDSFYGLSNQYSTLPLYAFLDLIGIFLSNEIIQKLIFFLVFFVSGVSMYKLCPEEWGIGRYFAGFLYMINPFIYVRFLAGHWLILLAYAISPIVIKSFMDFFKNPSTKRSLYAAFLITVVFFIETHTPFLLLIVFGIFYIIKIFECGKNAQEVIYISKRSLLIGLSLLLLNSYWLIPNFTGNNTPLGEITNSDLYLFTTKHDINFNTLFTTSSMYGFWRGGYLYTKDLLPYWYLFFIFILFLAVHGFTLNYRHPEYGVYVRSFGIVAVLSALLATGISGPLGSAFEFLFNNIFLFKGFREPQKFVALLVMAYAYLGGLGVAELEKIIKAKSSGSNVYNNVNKFGTWLLIALAISTPFIYSYTIFDGFQGQLKTTDYPKDWYAVNDYLNEDKQDFNILFMPWHLYMDFKWLPTPQKRIANPASIFFDQPVMQGENMEAGLIYSSSSNPVTDYIEFLLWKKDKIENFGELVAPLNVKYIILTKEVDYGQYDFLYKQRDLELVKDTENLIVFRNMYPVSKFYEADRVITIKGWEDLLDLSRTRDITSFAIVIGNETNIESSTGQALNYSIDYPARYLLDRPSKRYIVFSRGYSEDWKLEGKPPFANFGVTNAYDTSGVIENIIYYERFNIYLIGYIVSGIAFIFLMILYFNEKIRKRVGL